MIEAAVEKLSNFSEFRPHGAKPATRHRRNRSRTTDGREQAGSGAGRGIHATRPSVREVGADLVFVEDTVAGRVTFEVRGLPVSGARMAARGRAPEFSAEYADVIFPRILGDLRLSREPLPVLGMAGLPGSGKTSLAEAFAAHAAAVGTKVVVLQADWFLSYPARTTPIFRYGGILLLSLIPFFSRESFVRRVIQRIFEESSVRRFISLVQELRRRAMAGEPTPPVRFKTPRGHEIEVDAGSILVIEGILSKELFGPIFTKHLLVETDLARARESYRDRAMERRGFSYWVASIRVWVGIPPWLVDRFRRQRAGFDYVVNVNDRRHPQFEVPSSVPAQGVRIAVRELVPFQFERVAAAPENRPWVSFTTYGSRIFTRRRWETLVREAASNVLRQIPNTGTITAVAPGGRFLSALVSCVPAPVGGCDDLAGGARPQRLLPPALLRGPPALVRVMTSVRGCQDFPASAQGQSSGRLPRRRGRPRGPAGRVTPRTRCA